MHRAKSTTRGQIRNTYSNCTNLDQPPSANSNPDTPTSSSCHGNHAEEFDEVELCHKKEKIIYQYQLWKVNGRTLNPSNKASGRSEILNQINWNNVRISIVGCLQSRICIVGRQIENRNLGIIPVQGSTEPSISHAFVVTQSRPERRH